MIFSRDVSLSIEDIEESLNATRSILDSNWLNAQHKLQPADPLLLHLTPIVSPNFQIDKIRHGFAHQMHPIAEAVLVGQEIVAQFKRNRTLCGSTLLFLLASIRDVSRVKHLLQNIDEKIKQLQGPDWKSILYELLIAASHANKVNVSFVPERSSPTPDIKLSYNPNIFAECKGKLKYEDKIFHFIEKFRRSALGHIAQYLKEVNGGFLVRISLNTDTIFSQIPSYVREMITKGIHSKSFQEGLIKIEPFDPNEVVPPKPMSFMSEEFWDWAMGFKEWNEWHYILPGGEAQFSNLSNVIVSKVRRPILICLKANHLADNIQDIYSALKYACSKQFKVFQPGIVYMLINTNTFGLGDKCKMNYIEKALEQVSEKLFTNYSRIWKVSYDLVTPPPQGKYNAMCQRLTKTNNKCHDHPSNFPEISPVLLW